MLDTLQTEAPLQRMPLSSGAEDFRGLATNPDLILDAPYQRGRVWGLRRKQLLIRSLLTGTPIGALCINLRPDNSRAVVDGVQRLTALGDFLAGLVPVPASWWPQEEQTGRFEDFSDGPYLISAGLTDRGLAKVERCRVTVILGELATVEEEAAWFAAINFAGVPQGSKDPDA